MNYLSHLLSKQLSTLPKKKNSLWPFLISSPICHRGRQYLKIICYLPLTGDSTESRGTASKYSASSERECWLKWRFHDVKTGHLLYLLQHARAGLPPPDRNKIYYLTNLVLKKIFEYEQFFTNCQKKRMNKFHFHQCQAQKTFEIWRSSDCYWTSPDLDLYTTRP